jgi:transcriptional regulator with AAA-type ATPase domain
LAGREPEAHAYSRLGKTPLVDELDGTATQSPEDAVSDDRDADQELFLHLTILWSGHEPDRVGECCALSRAALLGRGPAASPKDPPKLEFARARPGENLPTGALQAPTLSRRQLKLTPDGGTLLVENVGKGQLRHNGTAVAECRAKPGDTLAVAGVLLCLVSERPRVLPRHDYAPFEFATPDADGILGETFSIWELRRELHSLAKSEAHAFIFGESGAGKELCARALHRQSSRGRHPLVSRNAATIPESLVEAELFGQAKNYPNAGAAERQGLIGLAHHSTLFLDEIGELGERQQANLLRVLDSGEYQRLGEDQLRQSDVRVLAATNRPLEVIKPDVLARFTERLTVLGLTARQGDVPLLVRHLLKRLAKTRSLSQPPTPSLELIDALCRHRYTSNFRELERLVLVALNHSNGATLELTDSLEKELVLDAPTAALAPERVRAVLAEARTATEAAHRLGLPSRFALYRLLKKLGMEDAPIAGIGSVSRVER